MAAPKRLLDFDDLRPHCAAHTDSHRQWRSTLRQFVDAHIAPHIATWNDAGTFPDSLYTLAADAGLLGMGFARECGGSGPMDLHQRVIFVEEFYRLGSSVVFADLATHWIGLPPIIAAASTAVRDAVAGPVLAGRKRIAFAVTEPGGGSDVAAIATRAERQGDRYLINGGKTLISGATRAHFLLTAVRTSPASGTGLSLLLIEADRPGVRTAPVDGLRWYSRGNGSIEFHDVAVPIDHLVGVEHQGFAQLAPLFNTERLSGIASSLALSRVAVAEAIAFARQRRAFGQRLIDHQVARHKLVTLVQQLQVNYACLDALVARMQHGEMPIAELAMLKVSANRTLLDSARDALHVLGGSAYSQGSRLERIYREANGLAVAGGAEEVLCDLAARQLGF